MAAADVPQRVLGRRAVEVDAGHGRVRPLEDDVLGLLHVEVRGAQPVEHVGQHARAVAMPHDQHVGGRRLRARFTTFGTRPVSLKVRTMRTVSVAIASWAWSVEAPMWCVP